MFATVRSIRANALIIRANTTMMTPRLAWNRNYEEGESLDPAMKSSLVLPGLIQSVPGIGVEIQIWSNGHDADEQLDWMAAKDNDVNRKDRTLSPLIWLTVGSAHRWICEWMNVPNEHSILPFAILMDHGSTKFIQPNFVIGRIRMIEDHYTEKIIVQCHSVGSNLCEYWSQCSWNSERCILTSKFIQRGFPCRWPIECIALDITIGQ